MGVMFYFLPRTRLSRAACCWLALLLFSAGQATASSALDVRVLLDVSERVHQRDQQNVRQTIVKALINQLPPSTTGGVWGYADLTQQFARHGQMSDMWKQVAAIHVEHLTAASRAQNPLRALTNVVWDLDQPDRGRVDLIWLSNGRIALADESAELASRTELIQSLGNRLAAARIVVHTVALGPVAEGDDFQLLQQLSEMTGGLHRVVSSDSDARQYVQALIRLLQAGTEAVVDAQGRFQVAPGTERFTVLWRVEEGSMPGLRTPAGRELSRLTSVPAGRWLHTRSYEIATLENPAPGWWQLTGPKPLRVGVFGDLQVKVAGLRSPVVPSEETSALIELFHFGEQLTSNDFLDLLDVRAWLVQGGSRQPLPIERDASGFRVYFLNLDDGAYGLEVALVGPTFAHQIVYPFTASNPLRVELRGDEQGRATAWLSFSHPDVDYAGLTATGKFRKPPQLGVIIPAQKMPSGLWQLALPETEGIVELSFSVKGNYRSGDGFFVKTQAQAVTLPIAAGEPQVYRFDAKGKQLAEPAPGLEPSIPAETPDESATSVAAIEPPAPVAAAAEPETSTPAPVLPWWFVLLISVVSISAGGLVWWFFRPAALSLPEPVDEPQAVAG